MHICFITNEYPKLEYPHGGIGTFIYTISHKLIEKGHKVTIIGINFYTKVDEVEKDAEILIYRLKPKVVKGLSWYFNNKSINKQLETIHKEHPIDIVETAELGLAFIKKNNSTKYVIRLHGGHHFFSESEKRKVTWWKGFQEKKSFRNADAFIAVSSFVKSHTSKYLSYHNKPIKTIRYPINLDLFKPNLAVKIEPNSLLFAGTICEKKGIKQLLMAMPKVVQNNKNVHLYVYGRDWFFKDGSSYIAYLKKDILPKLGGAVRHIHFMGAVPFKVLAKKYTTAEVCVFPSLMETQGLVAPEAMAMEKLVIFSNCGPGPETIEHKKTGLLCDPYDSDDIANQITWALSNKNECEIIARTGRQFVLSNFETDLISQINLDFYKSIIDNY